MPGNPITIRSLGPEDAFVLDRVQPGLFDTAPDPARVWAFLATRVNELVVALDQGQVVGLAYGITQLSPDRPTAFQLGNIRVHPDYRRQGIARRMMTEMRDRALDRGCAHFSVTVEDDNTAARALFKTSDGQDTPGLTRVDWPDL
jgi:ribosomal protein S18 acetylase RimI-like enzyme